MKKVILALLMLTICTLPSCVSVGLDDDTQKRVDAVTEQFKRLNDELEAFQRDLHDLTEIIKKIVERFQSKPDGNQEEGQ